MSANTFKIEHIFIEYHALLCNVSNNIVFDRCAAEDIVQDVFLNLWKRKDDIGLDNSLKGYLYKATTNASINFIKKQNKVTGIESIVPTIEEGVNDIEEGLDAKELFHQARTIVRSLPPKCRAIFVLNRYEGMKYREIAEHLDISVKTVETQMSIALSRLRDDLKTYVVCLLILLYFLF